MTREIQLSYEALLSLRFSETACNIFDTVNFAGGFVGLHNLTKSLCFENRDISKAHDNFPEWQKRAFDIADFLGSFSLIFRAIRSGPATAIWSWSVQALLLPNQFRRLFGGRGLLPINQIDRSVAVIAFLFGIPSTLKTLYTVYTWTSSFLQKVKEEKNKHSYQLSLRPEEAYLTLLTVSGTARRLLNTPHK